MPKVEEAMFSKNQTVVCVNKKMGGILPVLEVDYVYHIQEFIPPDECERRFLKHPAEWHKNGGRVEVKEYPGCYWYGKRFAAQ